MTVDQKLPSCVACLPSLAGGPPGPASRLASECHALAAHALADPSEVPDSAWSAMSAAAGRALEPRDPSRVLFVAQLLQSAGSAPLLDPGVASVVLGTARALHSTPRGRRMPEHVAVLASALARLPRPASRDLAAAWDCLADEWAAAAVADMLALGDTPVNSWERDAVVSAIAPLASRRPDVSLAALRWAVASLPPPPSANEGRIAPVLQQVFSAAPVLARSLARGGGGGLSPESLEHALAVASHLLVCHAERAMREVCSIFVALIKTRQSCALAGIPAPHLAASRAREAAEASVARGDVYGASCALFALQQLYSNHEGAREQACRAAPSCREEGRLLAAAADLALRRIERIERPESQPAPATPPPAVEARPLFARAEGLAKVCCTVARVLAERSPLFSKTAGPELTIRLRKLTEALAGPPLLPERNAYAVWNAAEALVYFLSAAYGHATLPDVVSHLRAPSSASATVPIFCAACRVAASANDRGLAAAACEEMAGALARPGDEWRVSEADASRALRAVRNASFSPDAAVKVLRAVVASLPLEGGEGGERGEGGEGGAAAATPWSWRLLEHAAPLVGLADRETAGRLADLACRALDDKTGKNYTDAALACLARPRRRHRAPLAAILARADAHSFPAALKAFALAAAPREGGAESAEKASRGEGAARALAEIDRAAGALPKPLSAECEEAVWWARSFLEYRVRLRPATPPSRSETRSA